MTATNPADLRGLADELIENIAISVLLQSGVLDAIVASNGEVVKAQEIASSTGYDEQFIGAYQNLVLQAGGSCSSPKVRFMRVATALLFCEEVDEAAYRPNQFTEMLIQPGWKSGLRFAEDMYPMGWNIRRLLQETSYGRPNRVNAPNAFEFALGQPLFKHLEANPELRKDFDLWMREARRDQETLWHRRYSPCANIRAQDLKSDPDAALMVDVGGANGSQLIAFHQQFPNLPGRCILQDISMPESNRKAAEAEGLEAMRYDMFTPQPIKGARYYYFRHVFHNWDDENMKKALANLVPAMEPGYSILLIDDYVLPRRNVQRSGAIEDILMLLLLGALERTTSQYENLLHGAGLEIVSIVKVGTSEEAIIEARVAPQRSTTN
ncbi:hypothetical protein DV737_g5367, partial [Chaetothyriales sp. CBS 132003]